MKKLTCLLLALCLLLCACGGNDAEVTEPATELEVTVPGSALEILETVWALYGEEEKFPVFGGDVNNMIDGAPGAYGLEDTETMAVQLLVPVDQAEKVTEAASLFHGMMLNNFTCGVFRVADGAAFADVMAEALQSNQWMCGCPEKGIVAAIGGEYVVMAFGLADAMDPFTARLREAYPETRFVFDDAIV